MARPIRVEFEGAVYHAMARGNERGAIFRSDQDRELFLQSKEADADVQIWARVRLGGERMGEVAREYGYRHQSGVTHAVKRVEARARADRDAASKLAGSSSDLQLSRVDPYCWAVLAMSRDA